MKAHEDQQKLMEEAVKEQQREDLEYLLSKTEEVQKKSEQPIQTSQPEVQKMRTKTRSILGQIRSGTKPRRITRILKLSRRAQLKKNRLISHMS